MKKLLYLSLFYFLFMACTPEKPIPTNDDFLLSLEEAISIAKHYKLSKYHLQSPDYRTEDDFETLSTQVSYDANDMAAIYTINYIENGKESFMLLSADERTLPVLSFGDGLFPFSAINPETQFWLDGQLALIEYVRDQNISLKEFEETYARNIGEDPEVPCVAGVWGKGPLLDHTWGQKCVYNNKCPNLSCTVGDCYSSNALVGCVVTAMVQIMGFHDQPENIPWDLMQNRYRSNDSGNPGAIEIAEAMAAAGNSVGMNYGCFVSAVPGSVFNNEVITAFEDVFGFESGGDYFSNLSTTQTMGWNEWVAIRGNINEDLPVILTGFRNSSATEGHAWVCDGWKQEVTCKYLINITPQS